ncbi:sensor histidine kinase [Sphaerotilus uruguayifluvii]|uniref:Signal transduction histidine-protein kinase/phosphatase MprB n=1 Tax=Sphaerotilus uruguayifluvii TaxID=2735897 RepID=A0ABX2FZJ9_9BURK|nr:HAMP domain-containing sensor histidine kinase [Leptothrix sp. C29]NRT55458.1 signal transduction histidine kinase [Leptothrix sp. C29]
MKRPAALDRLGVRLLLLFVLLALAMTVVFMSGMQHAIGGGWRGLVRPLVRDYVDRLAEEIGSPPDVGRAQALVARLPLSIRIDGPQVQWDSHPGLQGRPERPFPPRPPWHGAGGLRWMADPQADDDDGSERGWLLVTRMTPDGHRLRFGLADVPWRHRPRSIGGLTLALLLGLTLAAYALIRRWLRPLDDIRAGAQRYGRGEFDAPIPVRDRGELGRLAGQINTMAGDLHGMLEAKRALLLAISHELRSPLTRARLNAELVEAGASREALLRDLGEMGALIGDLIEGERLAAGHAALQREPVELALLVEAVAVETAEAAGLDESALARALDFALEGVPERLDVDPARWRLLVRNLVGNALRHGAAPVRVSLAREAGELVLTVRDHGPGVSDEALAHLGEAFYRPDAARGRGQGGVGLGLHLCRLVAQAHGGRLQLRAARPGLEVQVRMPWPEPAEEGDLRR